jgi:hypothetical protein
LASFPPLAGTGKQADDSLSLYNEKNLSLMVPFSFSYNIVVSGYCIFT